MIKFVTKADNGWKRSSPFFFLLSSQFKFLKIESQPEKFIDFFGQQKKSL